MREERFGIELWHTNGSEQVLARTDDLSHARSVYATMADKFAGQIVALVDRARILERSDWPNINDDPPQE